MAFGALFYLVNQENYGIWDNNLPTCKRLICPTLEPVHNLDRNCDDERNYVGTICRFDNKIILIKN